MLFVAFSIEKRNLTPRFVTRAENNVLPRMIIESVAIVFTVIHWLTAPRCPHFSFVFIYKWIPKSFKCNIMIYSFYEQLYTRIMDTLYINLNNQHKLAFFFIKKIFEFKVVVRKVRVWRLDATVVGSIPSRRNNFYFLSLVTRQSVWHVSKIGECVRNRGS